MFQSEVEKVIDKISKETNAEFSEAQIKCLAKVILKVVSQMIEEVNSTIRPNQGMGNNQPRYY